MARQKQQTRRIRQAAVFALVLAAYLCRMLPNAAAQTSPLFGLARSGLYVVLFAGWGISLEQRIIHPQVRRLLGMVDSLMVFWLVVRTLRFYLEVAPWLSRLLWYLYYLPMLGLTTLCVMIALILGQSEVYRLPRPAYLFWVPTVGLLALVLTNDLHQWVFKLSDPWSDHYTYYYGYAAIVLWIVICAAAAFAICVYKCRAPHIRRRMLVPAVSLLLMGLYSVLYALRVPFIKIFLGDMTVFYCLLIGLTLESGIQSGLFQSNTGYDELLRASSLAVQITDKEYNVRYCSSSARPLERATLEQAAVGPLRLDQDTLLKSNAIRGGRVYWQVDVAELASVMQRLEENRTELAERTYLEQQNYETIRQINTLREKNRLYDLLQCQTAPQMELLNALLAEYRAAPTGQQRQLLGKIAVVGAFLKRSTNLLFLAQRQAKIPAAELRYALEESLNSLELVGVDCGLDVTPDAEFSGAAALEVYRFFEAVVEKTLGQLDSILVRVRQEENALSLRISAETPCDLSSLAGQDIRLEQDGTSWLLNCRTAGENAHEA